MPSLMGTKKCLGIDIGATSIKVVELSKEKDKFVLKNYGIASIKDVTGKEVRTKDEKTFYSGHEIIATTLKTILKESKIRTKESVFAIPDYSSFFTSFDIPKMKKTEFESAIQYQARQRVPLPLSEVTLDWSLVELKKSEEGQMIEVLLLAVPNQTVKTYRNIALKAGLPAGTLDSETFGLARIYGEKDKIISVVDIGDQITTVNVLEGKIPKHSHSIDISGKDIKSDFDRLPEINYNEIIEKKSKELIEDKSEESEELLERVITSVSEDIAEKIKDVCKSYQIENNCKIEKIYLTGGGSKYPEIKEFLSTDFETTNGNPFLNIEYPEVLKETIENDIAPLFSIAVGMAMQGLSI